MIASTAFLDFGTNDRRSVLRRPETRATHGAPNPPGRRRSRHRVWADPGRRAKSPRTGFEPPSQGAQSTSRPTHVKRGTATNGESPARRVPVDVLMAGPRRNRLFGTGRSLGRAKNTPGCESRTVRRDRRRSRATFGNTHSTPRRPSQRRRRASRAGWNEVMRSDQP